MLKLNVLELLKKQGKTKYWLFNQLDMSYTNFNNIVVNTTNSINTKTLKSFVKF